MLFCFNGSFFPPNNYVFFKMSDYFCKKCEIMHGNLKKYVSWLLFNSENLG